MNSINPVSRTEPALEVLIAEDSLTQLMVLEDILQRHGFKVIAARNGRLAADALRSAETQITVAKEGLALSEPELAQARHASCSCTSCPMRCRR